MLAMTMKADVLIAASFVLGSAVVVNAIECDESISCDVLLQTTGSECKDGVCTNPFAGGCLRQMLGEDDYPILRVCNSDDDDNAERDGLCSTEQLAKHFNYPEIRISPNNWESAIFNGWILQIILSELLNVPVSIETGGRDETDPEKKGGPLGFYDRKNSFNYPKIINDFGALAAANELLNLDCRKTSKSCAHVLPELWQQRVIQPQDWSAVERDFLGMTGGEDWYIPWYTLEKDPGLGTYFGLQGEKNKEKLAKMFKRPTKWTDYCKEISKTNCTDPDDHNLLASPQITTTEGRSYYVEGRYNGYFRATKKNNCSLPNSTCTGHIVDTPCMWGAKTEAQLYWNNISLEDDIEYTYNEMIQVIQAANATQSDVILVWWSPEPTVVKYDYFPVSLPLVTKECLENRPVLANDTRCGASKKELRGNKEGSCGYPAQSLETFYASKLREETFNLPEVSRSPAYQFLSNFQMTQAEMREILVEWANRGKDKGYDSRHAVCSWVAKNIRNSTSVSNDLAQFLPLGYPREINEVMGYDTPLQYSALTLGAIGILGVLTTLAATYKYRACKIIRFAQVDFLYLFCLGYLLVCIGAILFSLEPSRTHCISRAWMVLLGYTLGNVPLLVKTAAINKLMQNAQKMKRIQISRRSLRGYVGVAVLTTVIFLAAFTAVVKPTRHEQPVLRSVGKNTVDVYVQCSSSDETAWQAASFAWQGIYIVFASLLAFQSRKVQQEFNESQNVGNMAYASFLFLFTRIAVMFMPSEVLKPYVRQGVTSILLSLDSMTNLLVYFGPKFWLMKNPQKSGASEKHFSSGVGTGGDHQASVPIRARDFIPQLSYKPGDKEFCSRCECPKCKPPIERLAVEVTLDGQNHSKDNDMPKTQEIVSCSL